MALPKDITSSPSTSTARSSTGRRASTTPSQQGGRRATASRSTRDEVIPLFHEIQREIESGSYELYAEVLRRTAMRDRQGARLAAGALARRASCRTPCQRWTPFKETNPQLKKLAKKHQTRPDLEHRRQAAGPDAPAHPDRLRPRRHRPAGALLQARPRALQGVRAAHRQQEGLGPRRVELLPRRRAVPEGEGPGDLGQPQRRRRSSRARRSRRPRSRPSSRPPSCSERLGPAAMQVVGLHADVVVCRSHASGRRPARSSATATRRSSSTRRSSRTSSTRCRRSWARRAVAVAACWPRTATGTTCLAALAFPDAALGVAETTAARLRAEPGDAQRALREFDDEHYVERPRPLSLGQVQALPVPGQLRDRRRTSSSCIPADGHTARRHGDLGAVGARAGRRRLPARRSRSRGCRSRAAAAPTWRRSTAWSRSSSRPTGSSPATARRSTPRARWRSCARTSPTSRRSRRRTRRCRSRGAAPAQRRIHAENVEKVGRGSGDPARRPRDAPGGRRGRAGVLGAARLRARRPAGRPRRPLGAGSSAPGRRSTCSSPTSPVVAPLGPCRRRGRRLRRDGRAPAGRRPRGRAARAALGRGARLRAHAGRPPRRAHGRPAARLTSTRPSRARASKTGWG